MYERKQMKIRQAIVSAAILLAPMITVTGAGATTVSNSIVPYSAQSCAGDVCMYLSTPSGGTVKVEGWPYSMGFYGHFQLTTPGSNYNSPAASWPAGTAGMYTFTNIPAIVGQYCIIGWSGGINEGKVCNSVL
jgi:hypothetical protein